MASTYTPKLNLAKPAHGDVDWHIPINQNWDDIDSKLGPLYEDISSDASNLTLNKNVDANGKNIDNVEILTVNTIKSLKYEWVADPALSKLRYSDTTNSYLGISGVWTTVKTTPAAGANVNGTVTINYNVYTSKNNYCSVRVLKNDIVISGSENTVITSGSYIIHVPVKTGDVFKLQLLGDVATPFNNIFNFYALMAPIVDESETWS